MRYHDIIECLKFKGLTIDSVGKNEESETHTFLVGVKNGKTTLENILRVSLKKIKEPGNSTPTYLPNQNKCMQIFVHKCS